tara:strand:+ start:230 stop:526 length:297 start_codon:yes stop_codon:yes gene_type:complete
MKKLLAIVVLGLFCSGNAYSKDVFLACQGEQNSNIILNDIEKKLIVNNERMIIKEWSELKIVAINKKNTVYVLDRVQATYSWALDKQYCVVGKLKPQF